ncbi:hypothetical protein KHQ81_15595 (plasmid) [Mycoplasmatota bacterium]|nr:hypothetical protein KHQ81_15595 [Mycoplasmatota bacterium]
MDNLTLFYSIIVILILGYHCYTDLKKNEITNLGNGILLIVQLGYLYILMSREYSIIHILLIIFMFITIGLNTVFDYTIILKKLGKSNLEDKIDTILTTIMIVTIAITSFIVFKNNVNYISYSYLITPILMLIMTVLLVRYTNSIGAGDGKLLMILGINLNYYAFILIYFGAVVIQLIIMIIEFILSKDKTNFRKRQVPFAESVYLAYLLYFALFISYI